MADTFRLLKVAAGAMRTSGAMLSRIFKGTTSTEPLISRLADLGPEWERRFIARRAPKVGLRVIDSDLSDLVDLVARMAEAHEERKSA